MARTDKKLVIKIKDGDGKVVAVDQMPLPPNSTTDLVSEIEIVDVPSRKDADRSPLSPDALRLSDLRVGMKIHVHYTGDCPWAKSYKAIVAGKPKKEERDVIIIPLFRLDTHRYYTGYAPDMGLTRYGWGSYSWSTVRYVTAED
jgi:hypothetical protein